MKNVLIAMDDSKESVFAFKQYVEKIHTTNNYIIAAYCAEYIEADMGVLSITQVGFDVIEGLITEDEKRILSVLDNIETLLMSHQVEGEVIRLEGNPGNAIITKASEVNATLIVMGSRGLGKIRRTFLGSVSDFVIHHSPVPVAICR
ncbi:putative universal stress protein SAUSA300_1656 isoform X1 [Ostrea edulis]|uniref:putative universal stress protein SAUSA300_1656 isoform X1 n=1 Tax=Ostrea edulis TaxID=37623 RepID=UPI002096542F|nr:putative universal stress protein SAUSA300_1656 isoform X1 [Ostrea edulis]